MGNDEAPTKQWGEIVGNRTFTASTGIDDLSSLLGRMTDVYNLLCEKTVLVAKVSSPIGDANNLGETQPIRGNTELAKRVYDQVDRLEDLLREFEDLANRINV